MIAVHVVGDTDAEQYVKYQRKNAIEMATHPEELRFFRHAPGGKGSVGHAAGLKRCFQSFDPHSINVVADSDTVIVMRGWDELLKGVFVGTDNLSAIGGTYEPLVGSVCQTGTKRVQASRPTLTWTAFAPGVSLVDCDLSPDKGRTLRITDDAMAKRYGLPVGHEVFCDVGWQLPQYYDERCIKTLGIQNERMQKLFPHLDKAHELFTFTGKDFGHFVCHQRSSMNHPFRGDKFSADFYDAAESLILRA